MAVFISEFAPRSCHLPWNPHGRCAVQCRRERRPQHPAVFSWMNLIQPPQFYPAARRCCGSQKDNCCRSSKRRSDENTWFKVVTLPSCFGAQDLEAAVRDNTLAIHAAIKKVNGDGGFDLMETTRQVNIPDNVDTLSVKTLWMKPGAILVVGQKKTGEAPEKKTEAMDSAEHPAEACDQPEVPITGDEDKVELSENEKDDNEEKGDENGEMTEQMPEAEEPPVAPDATSSSTTEVTEASPTSTSEEEACPCVPDVDVTEADDKEVLHVEEGHFGEEEDVTVGSTEAKVETSSVSSDSEWTVVDSKPEIEDDGSDMKASLEDSETLKIAEVEQHEEDHTDSTPASSEDGNQGDSDTVGEEAVVSSSDDKPVAEPQFHITRIDISGYQPHEVRVMAGDNAVCVSGHHVQGDGEDSAEYQFRRIIKPPEGAVMEDVTSTVDEEHSVLIVSIPLK